MSLIAIENVSKDYDTGAVIVTAVRNVSLEIRRGEFTALAGPSGSGKTTLLNLVGGLDRPTSGSITVGGNHINEMSPGRLSDLRLNRIGFIFQAYNLIPVLTAAENVEYILLLQGVSKEERRRRAVAILTEVGLAGEVDRLPGKLSGGQQQRVAVARAIVSEPEIVLADEPTANLDQKTGAALLDLMHDLNRKRGVTFLFSTHDAMVMERAERLVHLRDGTVEKDEVKKKRKKEKRSTAPVKAVKKKS